ncbi:MAG: hypothetical protein M1814_004979 [Vezdaea aestivalis]|nr:MAG: hypothetical protein M1814_004979 [Vezdaea aestivalis]
MATAIQTTPDTLITVKVAIGPNNRRFKIPLRELGASIFPDKLRILLAILPAQTLLLERFSDSAGTFIVLDSANPHIYKQLYRAAKAKLKLRIKATVIEKEQAGLDWQETAQLPIPSTSTNVGEASPIERIIPANPRVSVSSIPTIGSSVTDAAVPRPFPFVSADQPKREAVSSCTDSAAFTRLSCPRNGIRSSYTVYCNNCDRSIPDAHYHCNTCENGDFDLCQSCLDLGVLCKGADHWLIKRVLQNGNVIRSTTVSIAPKKVTAPIVKELPKVKDEPVGEPVPTRTCNCCIQSYAESQFITCKDCSDYDLCLPCHKDAQHGHHPGHAFEPVSESLYLTPRQTQQCSPGRHLRHHAICDGCNTTIYGIRHKCMDCPDWDFCNKCILSAAQLHPSHRFVPLYDPIQGPVKRQPRHVGIYCDGPLCKDGRCQTYITGDRYKCAVCNDTDFCSNCEAVPSNGHNKTHPLLKFKTPVRDVTVSTEGATATGQVMPTMGDFASPTRSTGTETVAPVSVNAATQVQTVAETVPSPSFVDLENRPAEAMSSSSLQDTANLDATFVWDFIRDGTNFHEQQIFAQTWTLHNPGPGVWPAGCCVKFIGGDNMLNVDSIQPSAVSELEKAAQSNALTTDIKAGSSTNFTISLRAPRRLGKNISYWRLTAPNGTKFGHKLWCDINVIPETPTYPWGASTDPRRHALQDYQMQLMLLEQQNRKRLTRAREEHAKNHPGHVYPAQCTLSPGPVTAAPLAVAAGASHQTRAAQVPVAAGVAPLAPEATKPRRSFNGLVGKGKLQTETLLLPPLISALVVNVDVAEPVSSSKQPTVENADSDLEKSEVIFPTLEKESPVSSQHEAQDSKAAEDSDIEVEMVEDIESLALEDEDSTEDGFLTDEEYDILDASDEEYLESQKLQK